MYMYLLYSEWGLGLSLQLILTGIDGMVKNIFLETTM